MISEKIIKTSPLITQHFPLDKYQEAYQFIRDNGQNVVKVMIDVVDMENERT